MHIYIRHLNMCIIANNIFTGRGVQRLLTCTECTWALLLWRCMTYRNTGPIGKATVVIGNNRPDFSSIHKLKFDVYHEARQSSLLFSPDRVRCFWSGINKWFDSLASWYTSNFNLCILLIAKWAVSFCWFPPLLTSNCDGDLKKGIQWVPRGKQRFPHNRLNPSCY